MSTAWDIRCVDCESIHGFDDANHRDREMFVICKHASAIAALVALADELGDALRLQLDSYGDIDLHWFAKHAGHRLEPISEYGDPIRQCPEMVRYSNLIDHPWTTRCVRVAGHPPPCSSDVTTGDADA